MEELLALALVAGFSRSSSSARGGTGAGDSSSSKPGGAEQLQPITPEATPDEPAKVPWGSIVGTGLSVAGTVTAAIITAAAGSGGAAAGAAGAAGAAAAGGAAAAAAEGAAAAGAVAGGTAAATGTTAGTVTGAAAGTSIGGGWVGLIIAGYVITFVVVSLIGTFVGQVVQELSRRAKYGVAGLAEWVRFTADQVAHEATRQVLQKVEATVVVEFAPSFTLAPEQAGLVVSSDPRLAALGASTQVPGRPERIAYAEWIKSVEGVNDRPLLRDVYRALQLLGLQMAETDNFIRWQYLRRANPNETEAQAEQRLGSLGLALSPSFFRSAVQTYWALRQYTPWGDPAPVDPLTGSDDAQRLLNAVFGARSAEATATMRLVGAANAWTWLQANQDLLSRPAAYSGAFHDAGLQVFNVEPDGTISWGFAAAPEWFTNNGRVIPRVLS